MANLQNKIDFAALISVTMANSNGDPLNGNRPRTDYNGLGEISDVCIKRKIRNRMQDLGYSVFVQSAERCDDGYDSLFERAANELKGVTDTEEYRKEACEKWIDVRTFGQVFAFADKTKKSKKQTAEENYKGEKDVSIGIRGPVSIQQAVSISPVEIESLQITKSVNGCKMNPGERAADTMGMKHFVRFGLYMLKGSINVQLAEKTGFTKEDADVVKECLRTLFVNDASSARPDGSMEVVKLYWWEHSCKDGQYSSGKVHRSLKVHLKNEETLPSSVDDYEISLEQLPGLEPQIIDGL